MKAFITMFNRLTWPMKLAEDLTKAGCEVILIDNNSTYEPLLKWYKKCPYKVYAVENTGCKSLWLSGVIDEYDDRFYIHTDHDLGISGLPEDWIDVLMKGFENKSITKSGLSLKLNDLPDNKYANEAKDHESRFWLTNVKGYWSAPIDTTLAIYDRERMKGIKFPFDLKDDSHSRFWNAVRSPEPYSARHLPWYNTPENITEEEKYYIAHIQNDGFWSRYYNHIWNS